MFEVVRILMPCFCQLTVKGIKDRFKLVKEEFEDTKGETWSISNGDCFFPKFLHNMDEDDGKKNQFCYDLIPFIQNIKEIHSSMI
jgi:hypothetical protein